MAMGDAIPDDRQDVICRCSGTTAQQIRRQFDKGVTDIDGISRATGACSGCGACDTDIMALLAEYLLAASPDPG
ncbi:(2Fe-2S)-binding protein [Methylococcus sp. ANG]|uniref:(2Fe-2S)-binding protein n=1 Tax=Methylococcus sp. ANG TaxID=3231903 RepID=UPI003457BECE